MAVDGREQIHQKAQFSLMLQVRPGQAHLCCFWQPLQQLSGFREALQRASQPATGEHSPGVLLQHFGSTHRCPRAGSRGPAGSCWLSENELGRTHLALSARRGVFLRLWELGNVPWRALSVCVCAPGPVQAVSQGADDLTAGSPPRAPAPPE